MERGLRAQVRTGNLLTGQLYVSLDFVPRPPPARLDAEADPVTVPTVPGPLADVQQEIADIVKRLGRVKFDEIGTIYGLMHDLVRNHVALPVRLRSGARKGELEWRRPSLPTLCQLLHHPIYAGA